MEYKSTYANFVIRPWWLIGAYILICTYNMHIYILICVCRCHSCSPTANNKLSHGTKTFGRGIDNTLNDIRGAVINEIFGHEISYLPATFTSDTVTSENHWRITL